jgi:hypothetical protein
MHELQALARLSGSLSLEAKILATRLNDLMNHVKDFSDRLEGDVVEGK